MKVGWRRSVDEGLVRKGPPMKAGWRRSTDEGVLEFVAKGLIWPFKLGDMGKSL
jgi:hypothetical protein